MQKPIMLNLASTKIMTIEEYLQTIADVALKNGKLKRTDTFLSQNENLCFF